MSPKLPLTEEERIRFRQAKIKMVDVHKLSVEQIMDILQVPYQRAKVIKGYAEFQRIPSIGHRMAGKLVDHLKIYSLEEIKHQNAMDLFSQLEKHFGVRIDPCVEDQIRCVIYHANNPGSGRQWFDFTSERKADRLKRGYPEDRPAYKRANS